MDIKFPQLMMTDDKDTDNSETPKADNTVTTNENSVTRDSTANEEIQESIDITTVSPTTVKSDVYDENEDILTTNSSTSIAVLLHAT